MIGDDFVDPSSSERILGVTLDTNLSVDTHLFSGDTSVLQQVSKKMRALWLIRRYLSFKSRKMTAWGLVMSKILYGIEIWGPAATEKQLDNMQVLQNSVLRWICNRRRGTRSRDLLTMAGCMSIRQLVHYRVVMSGLTAIWNKSPKEISQWDEEKSRRLQVTTRSFRFMFGKLLVKLPSNLSTGDPRKKKALIKNWIIENIPWDSKWEGLNSANSSSEESE